MVRTPVTIRELDPKHLTPEEAHALNRYDNIIRAELWPKDASVRPEVALAHWRFVPWYEDHHQWIAWTPEGEVVEETPSMTGALSRPSAMLIDPETNLLHAGIDLHRPTLAIGC